MLGLVGVLLASALGAAVVPTGVSKAASGNATFIVPADDSYGVAECTTAACGKVVADQWCVAQGFARSASFGEADPADVTGSLQGRKIRSGQPDSRPIAITCDR